MKRSICIEYMQSGNVTEGNCLEIQPSEYKLIVQLDKSPCLGYFLGNSIKKCASLPLKPYKWILEMAKEEIHSVAELTALVEAQRKQIEKLESYYLISLFKFRIRSTLLELRSYGVKEL